MSFPRYSRYRDSGVEWLGEVPEHWAVPRVGAIFRQADEAGQDGLEILSVSIHDGVSDRELDENEMERKVTRSDDRSKYKRVRPGDLVYNMMRAWQGGFGSVTVPGMVSPAYVVARPIADFSTAFVERVLRTPQAIEQMRRYSQGVTDFRLRLYWEEFKAVSIALPPSDEQSAIDEFLDRETAKIDALVAEQRRLIELLTEKRQAVISRAVAKGLNPNAPMKPSGIEWIGDVPAHWAMGVKLKSLAKNEPASFTNGPFGSDLLTSELRDEGVPVIYISDLKVEGFLRRSQKYVTEEKAKQLDKFRVDPGDILIAKVGDPPGFCCTYPEGEPAAVICQDVIRLKPNPDSISPDFLCHLLNASPGVESINAVCVEFTRKRFSLADLQSIRFPLPTRKEQDEIVDHLKTVTSDFTALEAEARRAIDLLQERRTALISAAVTGKIDVRGLVESEAA